MLKMLRAAAWAGAAAWVGLVVARGRFWDAGADRLREPAPDDPAPGVHAIVPARNEADVVERTLSSLLAQDYPGPFAITFVDDASDDRTDQVARETIARSGSRHPAGIVAAAARPVGWTGKVWALAQGLGAARAGGAQPAFWWFSDADVEHDPGTLGRLVATALRDDRALVSQMVELHCESAVERLTIPAFVFFFRMLYPFAWVNDDRRATAASAGGCVLVSDDALQAIGGIERIGGELIDDCALAAAVKGTGGGLRLELTTRSRSVRPYEGLPAVWSMVARTAYTQLRYAPALLGVTVAGMLLLYYVPVAATVAGVRRRRADLALPGMLAWTVMAFAYAPTLRLYRLRPAFAFALPLAAVLYAAMTVDSARRHYRREGGAWKGRTFTPKG